MESPILKLKREKGPNLILLSRAKTIKSEDTAVHAQWVIIKEWYDKTEGHPDVDWVDKAMTTVVNSIVHQNRFYFGMTYEKTRELLQDDSNWEKPIGLSNNKNGKPDTKYTMLCNKLVEAGIVEQIKEQGHKEPRCFKVISKDILGMLNIGTSPEDQEEELLNFVNNNKGLNRGSAEGSAKGETVKEKRSKEEKEKDSERIENISFKQLLLRQHPDGFPSFDDIPYLVQLAYTNCDDFDDGSHTVNIFAKHLKSTVKGKQSTASKKFMDKIIASFQSEAEKHVNLYETQHIDLKEPTELNSKALRQVIDADDAIQNNTQNILSSTFYKDEVKTLKRLIKEEKNKETKQEYVYELNFLESKV